MITGGKWRFLVVGAFFCALSQLHAAESDPASLQASLLKSFDEEAEPQSKPDYSFQTEEAPEEDGALEGAEKIKFVLKKIDLEGNTIFPPRDLYALYEEYIDKEVSPRTLVKIANKITAYFRDKGYILSRAYVPAQKIKHGMARIKVIEGFIDEVMIEWDEDMRKDDRICFYANRLKKIRPLDIKDLERALYQIRDLPGVTAKAILRPAKKTKRASDLIVKVKRSHFDVKMDINNDSTVSVGPWRYYSMLTFNDLLGENEQFSLYGSTTNPMSRMKMFGVMYNVPIFCDGFTKLFLKFDKMYTDPKFAQGVLRQVGNMTSFSIGVRHTLIHERWLTWSAGLWLDFKNLRNDLYNAAALTRETRDKIRNLRLETTFDMADSLGGVNLVNVSVTQGIKNLGAEIKTGTGSQQSTRPDGRLDFTKFELSLSRSQTLGGGFSAFAQVNSQYAATSLLSPERFSFGGAPFARSYESNFLSGDSGIEAKLEVRYTQPFDNFFKWVQLYGYYDYGMVWNNKPLGSEKAFLAAPGVGGGIKTKLMYGFSSHLEYGFPLKERVNTNKAKKRLYFGLTYSSVEAAKD